MVDEQITDHCLSTAAVNESDPMPILKLVVDESCQEALHHALLSSGTSPARAGRRRKHPGAGWSAVHRALVRVPAAKRQGAPRMAPAGPKVDACPAEVRGVRPRARFTSPDHVYT